MIRRCPKKSHDSKSRHRQLFLEGLEERLLLAAVVTDKLDYAPAETALITATDYQVGETVRFQVLHVDGTPNTGNGHEPWTVTDGGAGDLDGQANGQIDTSWFVDPDDSAGATFELSALGLSSGIIATHIFTDAGPPSNGNLFQWDPPGWVTGNNDGPYFEGDTVPYYTDFHNLVVGNVYSITIEWDTTKSGKHAIDYLRSYDATISFPPAVDPATDAGVNVITTDTFPIPVDTFMTTHPTFNGVQQPGLFKMYNGDITAVSPYNTPLTYIGDTSTSITVIFEAKDDGVGDAATTSTVLAWGGHIGTRLDWGLANSAVNIPGSPYHMRLDGFFDVTKNEVLGLGNTDRSLSAQSVIFPAIITVVKDAIPDDAQDFAFTTTGTGLLNFTLDDDGDNSNTLSNSQQFSVTNFDTKTITESLVPGWDLTNIQISELGGTNDSTFNLGTRQATLAVQEGEIITIRYTNRKLSSITVIKDALPNDLADFAFTSALLGSFSLDDDFGVAGATNTLLNSTSFSNLVPGTYVITEAALAGWDLTNLVISDPDGGSTVDLVNRIATIDLDAGEAITATFTNTKRGGITVVKDAAPNDLADFAFTSALLGSFSLDDDFGVAGATNTLLNSTSFSNLVPGTYVITEAALAGWDLTNLVISDPDGGSTVDLVNRIATIDLDAGEAITATFTNTKRGGITVVKDAVPNDLADFAFTSALLGSFSLDDDFGVAGANNTLLNSTSFSNLVPGTYVITEAALAGWDLTNLVISDPDGGSTVDLVNRIATIDLDAGEAITATFTNTKRGGITVVKDAAPNDLADFAFTSALLGSFSLDDDFGVAGSNNTLLNSTSFSNLVPGSYVITEAALAGWDLTNLVISDPDGGSTVDLVNRIATIDLDAGEAITATFTNTKRGGITVVKDAAPNDLADFAFTSALLGSFSLDDDFGVAGANNTLLSSTSFSNLVPGTYVITESALAGWDLTNLVISDPDGGSSVDLVNRIATIDLDAGEAITATFTNTKRGGITVVKDAVPNDLADFAFTSALLGSFSLDDDFGVAGATNTLLNSTSFSNLVPGTYVITEAALAGWDLTNLVISDPDGGSTVDLVNRIATIDLDAGEAISATFTNTKRGGITVVKDAVPNDLADFAFTSALLGSFSLDDDFGVAGATNTLLNSTSFSNLVPGTYVITEAALAGWDLTKLVISDPDGGSTVDLVNRIATIDLDAGEAISATFTNTKRGGITVIKDALPNDLADFAFTSALLGSFSLDDDFGVPGSSNTLFRSTNFSNLAPGMYVISESALAGWDLTNLVINDPDNGSSVNLVTRTATIDLDPGESLTVTFTNTKRGGITVVKDAVPNDLTDFAFTSALLGNFSLDDDAGVPGGNDTLLNSTSFSNLVPGTYVITEAALAGWDLTNLVINDPDNGSSVNLVTRTATIDVDPGESITATFSNTKRGRITVVKDAVPNDPADFAFTSALLGNFSLDDDFGVPGSSNTLFRSTNFSNLVPGTYVITESALAGWDLTNLVINDPDNGSSVNLVTRTATIDLDPGESLTATFTNTKRGGITVVKDAMPNALADFAFTSALLGNFSLDDDAGVLGGNDTLLNTTTFNNLVPGTYVIREQALVGWNLTNLVINDPDNGSSVNLATGTATIDVDPGEAITVTYTNTKRGRVTVFKDAIPNDLADFGFFSARLRDFRLRDGAGLGGDNTLFNFVDFDNLNPGTYEVGESLTAGWDLTDLVINDPDNGSSVNLATRTATIDLDPGEILTVTFTNTRRGGITVIKDAIPNDLADFAFTSLLLGNFGLDDDAGVAGGDNTLLKTTTFSNLVSGTYVITEAALAGWDLTNLVINDPDNGSSVDLLNRTATIDVDPGELITVTYTNSKRPENVVISPAKTNASLPYIHVVNSQTGEVISRFLAYEQAYRGGVRVATGDLTGDGIAEIVTAPGRGHTPLVRVWDQGGNLLKEFMAFSTSFTGGVDIAVGDVTGDGFNDIATAMGYNGSEVRIFKNSLAAPGAIPSFVLLGPPSQHFYPLGSGFKGGATIQLADMGTSITVNNVKQLAPTLDGKAEVIVGSGSAIAPVVKVFSYFGAATLPSLVRTINPLTSTYRGGISLHVININDDPGENIPDIIVGTSNGGGSQVQVRDGRTGAIIGGFVAFTSVDTPSYNAPIDVVARDESGDGIADAIFVVQGSDGTASEIRKFAAQSGALISSLSESAFDSLFAGTPINDFAGAFYIATLDDVPQAATQAAAASLAIEAKILPVSPPYFDGGRVVRGDLNDERTLNQNLLYQFLAYGRIPSGGVDVAPGVNGDGKLPVATSMLNGGKEARTFRNITKATANLSKISVSRYGKSITAAGALAEGKSGEVHRNDPLTGKLVDAFFDQYPGA